MKWSSDSKRTLLVRRPACADQRSANFHSPCAKRPVLDTVLSSSRFSAPDSPKLLRNPLRRSFSVSYSTPAERRKLEIVLRSEEHTSELQSRFDLVCRLLLEKKK